MADTVALKGFPHATVADVISRARVSRETFYEQFSDKEDCFDATLEAGAEGLIRALSSEAPTPPGDLLERLDRVLEVYLEVLVARPEFAKAFLVDAFGAGRRATARRIQLQDRFVDLVAEMVEVDSERDRFACEALVAAISSMVTVRVAAGRFEELPALRAPIIELVRRLLGGTT
jgi:AcrR family transcriptional regulator